MQISNVSTGYPDLATLGKRNESSETASRPGKLGQMLAALSGGSKSTAAEIVAKYDVAKITPTEFSTMVQKLRQSGALSDSDFQELSGVRLDLDTAGIQPDEKINLREFYADKVKDGQQKAADPEQQAAAQQSMGPVLRRYQWVEKFALMQANPDGVGVDAVA
jgi:hypothetical protein